MQNTENSRDQVVACTKRKKIYRPYRHAGKSVWHWVRNRELSILLPLFILSALLWSFVELADEVNEGATQSFDQTILLSLRTEADLADPIGPGVVEEMVRDITALGGISVLLLTTIAVVGYLLLDQRKGLAAIVIVATVGALILSTILKQTIERPRPELVPHATAVYTASFPSGHSMQAASTYLTLGALLARVQRRRRIKTFIIAIAAIVTILVGVSRVYLGVHWPTDVLAGWTAGTVWALMCWLLARWLNIHGQLKDEGEDEDIAER